MNQPRMHRLPHASRMSGYRLTIFPLEPDGSSGDAVAELRVTSECAAGTALADVLREPRCRKVERFEITVERL
jgi:hypothetical protein